MRYQKVNIEISNICNLQCTFCPEVKRPKGMMEPALFRSIIQQVTPLTDLVCLHLMGEPLAHPKLSEFVDICEEFGTKIFFVTNGVLLRGDKIPTLLRSPLYQVNFSLHSFFDNHPGQDPTDYLNRIFAFSELAFTERPDLYINFRLWNLQDLTGSAALDNAGLLARISERFNVSVPSTVDVRKKKSFHLKNRLYLHFDTEFTWPSLALPEIGSKGRCLGLSNHFGILTDGTVVPCCLDKEGDISLGKISNQPLAQILESPRARKMKEGFQSGHLVEDLCRRCQYIERFS